MSRQITVDLLITVAYDYICVPLYMCKRCYSNYKKFISMTALLAFPL
ncbi:MAG TPA: hypothetical protein GXZ28_01760 [Clostridiales bacterium]|nr:hypothetical protein [Clostridiales bacterium]